MSQTSQTIVDPELTDALIALRYDIFRSFNCVAIGSIQSFDGTKKTAKVQCLFKRTAPNGNVFSLPVLADVPVFTLQGGGGYLQFPISSGDNCLLLFSDRGLDAWFKTGTEQVPFDSRCHDLSDGIALVGVNSLVSSMDVYQSLKSRWAYAGAEIDLAMNIVTIKNATTTLLTLLNGLITVIEGLQVNGPLPLTAASIAALEAYKLVLAGLLG